MILCPFCSYLNGISNNRPNIKNYVTEDLIHWFGKDFDMNEYIFLLKAGAKLTVTKTGDYILEPTIYSDFLDCVLFLKKEDDVLNISYWIGKSICEVCVFNLRNVVKVVKN